VDEDSDEEYGVKVWDGCGGANDSAPGEAHHPVRNVILESGARNVIQGARRGNAVAYRLPAICPPTTR
jgi:hypothetical protein